MATIEDFIGWITADLARFAPADQHVHVVSDDTQAHDRGWERRLVLRLYTAASRYQIAAVERGTTGLTGNDSDGYLGATVSARAPRPGEDQTRGRDLTDGPLDRATWDRILRDIVACELVQVRTTTPLSRCVMRAGAAQVTGWPAPSDLPRYPAAAYQQQYVPAGDVGDAIRRSLQAQIPAYTVAPAYAQIPAGAIAAQGIHAALQQSWDPNRLAPATAAFIPLGVVPGQPVTDLGARVTTLATSQPAADAPPPPPATGD